MNPRWSFIVWWAIHVSVSIPVLVSSVSGDQRYVNCSQPFKCGDGDGIGDGLKYPFWGANRAEYCGRTGFGLECESGVPKIRMNSEKLRVIEVDPDGGSMRAARDDFWGGTCGTPRLENTTIDTTVFRYDSGAVNLTLSYSCSSLLSDALTMGALNCTTVMLYASIAPILATLGCRVLLVPVLQSALEDLLNRTTSLANALDQGFPLTWDVGFQDECRTCGGSGGECGFNQTAFACFCPDGSYPEACPATPSSGKNSEVGLVVGISVGSVAVVIGIMGVAYFVVRRRKRKIDDQSKTEDLPSHPPSSSSLISTSKRSIGGDAVTAAPLTTKSYYVDAKSNLRIDQTTFLGLQVFSHAELEAATNNFDASNELGNGGFGIVYYGKLSDGRAVAVKRLYDRSFKGEDSFMMEVKTLTRLRHPNLVTLYGCTSRRSSDLFLVYEYVPNGTLADHLHGGDHAGHGAPLSWPIRLRIATETATALAYLHASKTIHRDVKTNNILLDRSFHVKVADFGISRLLPSDATHVSTAPQGTPGYVDPAYYQRFQLTGKSDVYSFGVVMAELVSSMPALDPDRHGGEASLASLMLKRIQNRLLQELVDPSLGFETDGAVRKAVTAVAELTFRCLQEDVDDRPCMDEVVEALREIEEDTNYNMESFSPDSVAVKWVSTSTTSESV